MINVLLKTMVEYFVISCLCIIYFVCILTENYFTIFCLGYERNYNTFIGEISFV